MCYLTWLISFQCKLYATHIKRSLSIWGFYLSSPFVFYSFLLADKPCFSIYSLISTLISLLLHNIEQSFLPMYRDIYVYTFFSLFKNTKTFSNCSFTYFGPIQALSKSLFYSYYVKNLSIPEISFTPIKQQIWLK